jgi:type I restriction enzyme S subunit
MTRFADLVHLNTDRIADPLAAGIERFVGLEHIEPENLHIRSSGLVADGTTFTNHFKPGQVLFGKRRAYQRKVAVADFNGVCSSDIYVFESKDPNLLLPELLPFICQSEGFFEYAVKTSAGSLSPRTNWSHLANYEFPLPPLDEQCRIADLLWAADDVITQHQEVATNLKQLWIAAASHYFSRTNGHQEFRLGDLLEYGSDGPFGSKLKTEHYVDDGVRVIRLQNIQENYFDDTDRAYISTEYYQNELVRYTVNSGDVLVAGLGDESIRAGRACVAPSYLGEAINKADCYCLRPKSNLNSNYLVAFFNSPYGLRQSESFAQGTTRFRLNLGNIKRMKISLPDLRTQVAIAEKLYEIQKCTELEEQHIENSIELKKQLLNKMLAA